MNYHDQKVIKICQFCGREYPGHPTSKYCPNRNCKERAHRQRGNRQRVADVREDQYSEKLINPSAEKFQLSIEIQSKGTNQKPVKIYQLSQELLKIPLPDNVELFEFPPDDIMNTDGILYYTLVNITPTTKPAPTTPVKHFNAYDILNKHLPSETAPSEIKQVTTSKPVEFREVLTNPTPDQVFAVCDYYTDNVDDLRPTKVFGEPPKSVPEHVEVYNHPEDNYYILQPL